MNPGTIKRLAAYLGYVLVALSVYAMAEVLYQNWDKFYAIPLTAMNLGLLSIATLFYLLGYLLFSIQWQLQLRAKYPDFTLRTAFSIIGRSQIGKYLPGNIGQYLTRLVLLPDQVRKLDFSYTLVVETAVMLFTSASFGALYIFYFDFLDEFGASNTLIALTLGLCLAAVLFGGLKFLRQQHSFLSVSSATLLKLLMLSYFSLLLGGITIKLLLSVFQSADSATYFQCATGFALSFVAGFVVPGAPGGIGIREFVFVLLFAGHTGEATALEVILTFRLLSIIGDVLLFALAHALRPVKLSSPAQ